MSGLLCLLTGGRAPEEAASALPALAHGPRGRQGCTADAAGKTPGKTPVSPARGVAGGSNAPRRVGNVGGQSSWPSRSADRAALWLARRTPGSPTNPPAGESRGSRATGGRHSRPVPDPSDNLDLFKQAARARLSPPGRVPRSLVTYHPKALLKAFVWQIPLDYAKRGSRGLWGCLKAAEASLGQSRIRGGDECRPAEPQTPPPPGV